MTALKLRFENRYSREAALSPIKIRFVYEQQQQQIANFYDCGWQELKCIEQTNELYSDKSHNVSKSFNVVMTNSIDVIRRDSTQFLRTASVECPSFLFTYTNAKHKIKYQSVKYSIHKYTEQHIDVSCTVSNSTSQYIFAASSTEQLISKLSSCTWSLAHNTNSNCILMYGPRKPIYVCRFSDHPRNGYVKMSFRDKRSTGSVTLRFSNPGLFCYWTLHGGVVRSDDDIPTLDRKIPVEPQIQSSYIMTPTIKCCRINDNLDIAITSFSYSFARGQFAASGSVRFSSRIDMERAIGQTLLITINGYEFVMLCEQPSTSLKFANKSYSANLRSRFAELSAPYVRENNYTNKVTKTLEGLITDALANSGWTVQSQLIDYPVPANTFSYQGLTPAAAILQVAKSVGAILVFDDKAKKVNVLPEWPVNPWDVSNATCDVIINDSLILEHSTRRTISPEYTAIFVRGEQSGVSCKVKRAGSAGDDIAPDVVDSLITDVQAARQRGTCELARTGNKQVNQIKTKLLPNLPPFKPGMLVGIRYTDSLYKATCESVSISASITGQGAITISQSIEVISNV
ncbi:hypothetical protein [Pseudoalteromonas umbrosa]|uniref:hypothetical protein n=1 Tax=Pseudoalteromonas umbrosa TaxID=3048489 RepID=UPI0024C264F4|nr:hypothetical protein [Pseudoalteromonas sp. B95]MDK1288486.1 hypothetical protein [Pseudoalteromonas sp. B95]